MGKIHFLLLLVKCLFSHGINTIMYLYTLSKSESVYYHWKKVNIVTISVINIAL